VIDPQLRDDDSIATTDRLLRQFAGLWLAIFGGMALFELTVRHRDLRALVLALAALTVGPLGLVRPQAIRAVFKSAMALATPIGWVVSRVLLAIIFYGLFTPVAMVLRAVGRDPLQRRRDDHVKTYWKVKPEPSDLKSYLRQL
jgi:hypothetical protein